MIVLLNDRFVPAAQAAVSVADRGPGLVPGTEETIFERYYRGTGGADAGRSTRWHRVP